MGAKARPARQLGLSDEWREWVVQSLLEGVAGATIIDALVKRGTPRTLALRELDIIRSATRLLRQTSKRFELQLRLQGELEIEDLEVRARVNEQDFYRHYFSRNRPVLLTDEIRHWPQVKEWSPAWLSRRFGDVVVHVNDLRGSDPNRIVDPESHLTPMRLDAFVQYIESDVGNETYLVSRNRALEGPLSELLDSFDDLPNFLESDLVGRASMWLGPAGTLTPLHHDTTNVFFCQIYGKKRITLVSPRHLPTLSGELRSTFYSDGDPGPGPHTAVVDIEPGQALFLPVGWWHQIEALTPSISLSLTGFKRRGAFDWYRPGAV